MTPAARLQTAIEILDAIAAAAREGGAPADAIFAEAMRARRYAGSKDRRAIRAHVYDAIRAVRSAPASGRAAMLALADADPALIGLFDGSAYGPAPIAPGEARAETGLAAEALVDLFDPLVDADEAVEVFVRDRGKGFDVDEVLATSADRHGVRDSIRGRMERHGGTAMIRTSPGEGTEVRLRMPRAPYRQEKGEA